MIYLLIQSMCLRDFHAAEGISDPVSMDLQLFQLDMVMMSIVLLCIMSAGLYKGISMLEQRYR